MVICETSEQARKLFAYFDEIQAELNKDASMKSHLQARLILHDSDDKDTRDKIIDDFKNNMTVDILIVFNMLLTGFDAPRLKRLYFGRKLKDHNLLQAITRVNRPYKENRYGYVIDFANIKRNFEETNEAQLSMEYNFGSCKEIEACQLVTVIAEFVAIYGNKNKNIDKSYGSPGGYDGEVIETMEDLFLLALFEIYTNCVL